MIVYLQIERFITLAGQTRRAHLDHTTGSCGYLGYDESFSSSSAAPVRLSIGCGPAGGEDRERSAEDVGRRQPKQLQVDPVRR